LKSVYFKTEPSALRKKITNKSSTNNVTEAPSQKVFT